MKRGTHLGFGVVVAVVFLWLLLKQAGGERMVAVIRSAAPGFLLLGLVVFVFDLYGRAARWSLMLRVDSPQARTLACFPPFLASLALNNVLPFRAGDFARAFAFNQRLGTRSGQVLASLFVERLLDLASILCFLAIGLWAFDLDELPAIGHFGAGAASLTAIVIFSLLAFPRWLEWLLEACLVLLQRFMPRVGDKLAEEMAGAVALINGLGGRRFVPLIILSLAVWGLEGAAFWCVGLALSALAVPAGAWLAMPVATLATLIPSTPGYVGTFDYFGLLAMAKTGNEAAAAAAFTLLAHALLWFPPTLVGGGWLLIRRIYKKL
jgi:uncharacterized protein (TIRG00374 family)